MRAEKLRGVDAADLQRQAQEAQEQLFRLRFQMGMGQTEGLKKYRNLKKDRARMMTVLSEKRAAGETIPEPPPIPRASAKKGAGKKLSVKKDAVKKGASKKSAATTGATKKTAAKTSTTKKSAAKKGSK